jgi:hypothetical protein
MIETMQPEVLIGEAPGGLPEAPNWKVWYDFLNQTCPWE